MLRFGSAWRISLVSILIHRATYITNASEIMIDRLQKSPQCIGVRVASRREAPPKASLFCYSVSSAPLWLVKKSDR